MIITLSNYYLTKKCAKCHWEMIGLTIDLCIVKLLLYGSYYILKNKFIILKTVIYTRDNVFCLNCVYFVTWYNTSAIQLALLRKLSPFRVVRLKLPVKCYRGLESPGQTV